MFEEKMRRKIEGSMEGGMELEMTSSKDRWGVLQENLTEEIEASELKRERIWVKEGECDECGAYDVLSRVEDKFICPECAKLLNSKKSRSNKNNKNNKDNKKNKDNNNKLSNNKRHSKKRK